MIDSTRLAEIREWAGPVGGGYGKSPFDAEILAFVTAYEAARDLVESSRSGSMNEIHAAMHALENLFPEPYTTNRPGEGSFYMEDDR